jgi:hypothetical protein
VLKKGEIKMPDLDFTNEAASLVAQYIFHGYNMEQLPDFVKPLAPDYINAYKNDPEQLKATLEQYDRSLAVPMNVLLAKLLSMDTVVFVDREED